MNRKQRRTAAAQERKSGNEDLAEKMGMFDRLPDECTACTAPFDKKDRKMVTSWFVTVRQQEKKVRLYCPTCWETAQRVVKQYEEKKKNG
tara:strand:+ start:180 stop:449 length:270 start_codon:yes stop_codon:yes gene_type:complete